MNINESEYLWASPSEPLSVVLTAGENPITFNNVIRLYKIKGTGNIKIYEDSTKETVIYEGSLPYKLEERACFDSLYIEVEEDKTIQLVLENGSFKEILTPYLNTKVGMQSIMGSSDGGYASLDLPFNFKIAGGSTQKIKVFADLYFEFDGISNTRIDMYRRDGRSTEIFSQIIDFNENIKIGKIRFEGSTVWNNNSESNIAIYELFIMPSELRGGMFLNIEKIPTTNTGTRQFICASKNYALDNVDHNQIAFYPKDINGGEWDLVYENYKITQALEGETFKLIFNYAGKNHKFTGEEFVEVPMTEYDAASFIEYGKNIFPSSEYYTPLQDPKVYSWSSSEEAAVLSDVAVCYPYPSDITFHMNLDHPSIFGISGCDMEYTGNVGILVSVDEGVTYDEEVPAASWLSTGWVNLWSRLPTSKILYIKLRLHGDATVTNFKIHYINTEE